MASRIKATSKPRRAGGGSATARWQHRAAAARHGGAGALAWHQKYPRINIAAASSTMKHQSISRHVGAGIRRANASCVAAQRWRWRDDIAMARVNIK